MRLGLAALRAPLSIRSQLIALVLVIVVPLLGIYAWLLAAASQQARRAAGAEVRLLASDTAARLAFILREHREFLERIGQRPLVTALDAERCDPVLGEYARRHKELADVELFDRDGRRLCSALPVGAGAAPGLLAVWVPDVVAGEEFRVGDAQPIAVSGRWVAPLMKPVRGASGADTGLLVATLDLPTLQTLLIDARPGAVLKVLDGAGRVLMRSANADRWIGKVLPAPYAQRVRAHGGGDFAATGIDGRRWLYAPLPMPLAG